MSLKTIKSLLIITKIIEIHTIVSDALTIFVNKMP